MKTGLTKRASDWWDSPGRKGVFSGPRWVVRIVSLIHASPPAGNAHREQENTNLLLRLLPVLLPLAVRWAEREEKRILRKGVALVEPHLSDARIVGVEYPERIRLLKVRSIPPPSNPILKFAAHTTGLVSQDSAGMALRYGILIREEFSGDRNLNAHECVHTSQYERLGGFNAFLSRYLRECLECGYPEAPLEQEAMLKSAEICG
jgi:hypothetical protein